MPRANRFYVPGAVWHITRRCHGRQFLLKFERDRLRWKYRLFEAIKRYGLYVLNCIVTSNHIHLLVKDTGRGEIARGMQLISGRTAQEYNQRKSRKGAFWEDRYFATAVSTDRHLVQCLLYVDFNMVRTGIINHPAKWKVSGFHEIQSPPQRYKIINQQALCDLMKMHSLQALQEAHSNWVTEHLRVQHMKRQSCWTESIDVGSEAFVMQCKAQLGSRALYRTIEGGSGKIYKIQDGANLKPYL